MTNLARFENDGIELVIDTNTGEAFASQTGYARMSGLIDKPLTNVVIPTTKTI